MSVDTLGRFLTGSMEWAMWFKAVMFFIIWLTMSAQPPITRLGVWINRMFFTLYWQAASVALFIGYISSITHRAPIGWYEWFLVVIIHILPFLVAVCGIMVTYYTRQIDRLASELERKYGIQYR